MTGVRKRWRLIGQAAREIANLTSATDGATTGNPVLDREIRRRGLKPDQVHACACVVCGIPTFAPLSTPLHALRCPVQDPRYLSFQLTRGLNPVWSHPDEDILEPLLRKPAAEKQRPPVALSYRDYT